MPQWIIDLIVQQVLKLLTPDVVKKFEAEAIQFVCCKLAAMAKTTPTDLDDEVVQRVASALGADLTKCPA